MHGFLIPDCILDALKTYQIDLKSLPLGTVQDFSYTLGNEYFRHIGNEQEIKQGNVNVSLSVLRTSSVFEMEFHTEGAVTVPCDYCLEDMEIHIETDNRLVLTFGKKYTEADEQHITIPEEESKINVAWYMYEFVALAIPMKRVHKPGDCNEVMASKLKELCVESIKENEDSLNIAEDGGHAIDPRWEALRDLKTNN